MKRSKITHNSMLLSCDTFKIQKILTLSIIPLTQIHHLRCLSLTVGRLFGFKVRKHNRNSNVELTANFWETLRFWSAQVSPKNMVWARLAGVGVTRVKWGFPQRLLKCWNTSPLIRQWTTLSGTRSCTRTRRKRTPLERRVHGQRGHYLKQSAGTKRLLLPGDGGHGAASLVVSETSRSRGTRL